MTPHDLPAGPFDLILADPPWRYNRRNNSRTRFGGGAHSHYEVMSDRDILELPVGDLTAPSALLFLWVTHPRLPLGLDVVKAWGFRFSTVAFTWAKLNPSGRGFFFGIGCYSKSNAETCLLGVKGRPGKPAVNTVSSLIGAPRREHSRKPDEAAARIEAMYPTLSKIEMFARERRPGWTSWGHGVAAADTEPGAGALVASEERKAS